MSDSMDWGTVAEWATAAAAAAPVLGALIVWVIVRPLNKSIEAVRTRAEERHDEIKATLKKQDQAAATAKADVDRQLTQVRNSFGRHEEFDSERFIEVGDKVEAQVSGLRRDMVAGHTAAIGQLSTRIDTMAGQFGTRIDAVLTAVLGRQSASGDD